MKYQTLHTGLKKAHITKKAVAQSLGITPRTLQRKLRGQSPLLWEEACVIRERFFPYTELETLFADQTAAHPTGKGGPP